MRFWQQFQPVSLLYTSKPPDKNLSYFCETSDNHLRVLSRLKQNGGVCIIPFFFVVDGSSICVLLSLSRTVRVRAVI